MGTDHDEHGHAEDDDVELDSFEQLMRDLLKVPKSEVDAERKRPHGAPLPRTD